MAGRISPELKEQILARTDIVEIVGARVPLRPAGQLYKACCPFHQEKTPSFFVTPARQSYHCFGCGVHGDAISFLMEYDRMSFPEAMEALASRAGIALPEAGASDESNTPQADLGPLYQILEEAAGLYHAQLREDARAIAYLKERGLTGEIAVAFGLGFAPPGWDFLLTRLGGDSARRQVLIDAGLVIERDQDGEIRRYDRFRNRIMFPIRDRRGRVIAFGGRVLDQTEPKYLNSPETPVFHKGRELYGLFEARERQRPLKRLLIVEGYMDVIALAQFGLPYAVATLGTATTADQVQRLKRQVDELVYCFDGDKAGRGAAWKALRVSLPFASERLTLRFLLLPAGHDPDSLLRAEGLDAFEARLEQAQLLSDFLFDALRERFDLGSAEGRARCDAEARELIALAPSGTYRQLLLQQLEELIGLQHPVALPPRPTMAATGWRARAPRATPVRGRLTAVRLASALLLRQPRLALAARQVPEHWTELDEDGMELLHELLAHADADPDITTEMLRECYRGSVQEPIVTELADPRLTQHIPEAGMEPELVGALSALCRQAERERRYRLLSSGQLASLAGAGQAATAMSPVPKGQDSTNQGG